MTPCLYCPGTKRPLPHQRVKVRLIPGDVAHLFTSHHFELDVSHEVSLWVVVSVHLEVFEDQDSRSKAVPKTKIFREEVHFFLKDVYITCFWNSQEKVHFFPKRVQN